MKSLNSKRKNPVRSFRYTGFDYEPFVKEAQKQGLSVSKGITMAMDHLYQLWISERKQ